VLPGATTADGWASQARLAPSSDPMAARSLTTSPPTALMCGRVAEHGDDVAGDPPPGHVWSVRRGDTASPHVCDVDGPRSTYHRAVVVLQDDEAVGGQRVSGGGAPAGGDRRGGRGVTCRRERPSA
jgi:hypothetical protein